jgi:hypothetical protein
MALAAIGCPTWRGEPLVVSHVGGDHVRNLPHSDAMGNEQIESELMLSCVSSVWGGSSRARQAFMLLLV